MRQNPFDISSHVADMVGLLLLVFIAIGVGILMWLDYQRYSEEHLHRRFDIWEFIRQEQLYLFLFLTFFFLIGGELLLYHKM